MTHVYFEFLTFKIVNCFITTRFRAQPRQIPPFSDHTLARRFSIGQGRTSQWFFFNLK